MSLVVLCVVAPQSSLQHILRIGDFRRGGAAACERRLASGHGQMARVHEPPFF